MRPVITLDDRPYAVQHSRAETTWASCVLAESLGSIGATLYAQPEQVAVGVDINATHHRAVSDGIVTAVATPVHLGRSIACYEIVVSDDQARRVCTARITCQLIEAQKS